MNGDEDEAVWEAGTLAGEQAGKLAGQAGRLAGIAGIAGMAGRLAGWQAGKLAGWQASWLADWQAGNRICKLLPLQNLQDPTLCKPMSPQKICSPQERPLEFPSLIGSADTCFVSIYEMNEKKRKKVKECEAGK